VIFLRFFCKIAIAKKGALLCSKRGATAAFWWLRFCVVPPSSEPPALLSKRRFPESGFADLHGRHLFSLPPARGVPHVKVDVHLLFFRVLVFL
jgi:hypothetical protein